MSDITYARKADRLTDVETDGVPERLALAQVHATQGVARALREVDNKLKYVADEIVRALPQQVERWVTWRDFDGTEHAISTRYIQSFKSVGADETAILTSGDAVMTVPLSYGVVAMMVGA